MWGRRPLAASAWAAVIVLAAGAPAEASYRDGFMGFIFLLYSLPIALVAVVCTLFLWSQRLFTRSWIFFPYCTVFVVAVLAAATWAQGDPTSAVLVLVGDGILLLPVLLPAIFQYLRARPG